MGGDQVGSVSCKSAGKKLKRRETEFDKAQPETEELSLRNRSLTKEIMRIESGIQDLCEDLAKNENCACGDEKKSKSVLYFLCSEKKKS